LRKRLQSIGVSESETKPEIRMATAMVTARARPELTAYDGHLVGLAIPSPASTGQVVSPTRLEAWAICPYAYFVRYLLDVEPVEDPEELLNLAAIEQGILVHRALDGYIDERIAEGGGLEPDLAQLARHFELACRAAEARGVTGRSVLWRHQRDELWRHLVAFVEQDARRCDEEGSLPLATELRFGFPGAQAEPIEVGIGGDRALRFRGSADRVDRAGDGHLVVTDYKYSSTYKYNGLSQDEPTAAGSLLQLPIYALAAQAILDAGKLPLPVTARYAFVKPDASKGALPKATTLEVDEPLLARWSEALAVIADGIEDGVFAARPGNDTRFAGFIGCPACDPDGLGTAELQRRWDRKRRSPELAAYLRLLGEPTDDADGADDVGDGEGRAEPADGQEDRDG
jgi:RecB family exonuclease